eukprot:m.2499 g.2499  ORF g.2499 m.2499 type:complete len:342 (+) comp8712_c0_seq1:71-1096(+)
MDLAQFEAAFPSIVEDSLPTVETDDLTIARDWIKQVLEYNVPYGKKNRGLAVITSYARLVGGRPFTAEETKKLQVLGWCVEILQAWLLVADDVMDGSHTRRGKPCWFRKDGIGMIAVNDAFLMETIVFKLLKMHFRSDAYYVDLVELFLETSLDTEIGQTLDLLTSPSGKPNLEQFTPERYKTIVKYKTAFYSFYLPVALAMRMAGLKDESDFERAQKILLLMGEYFQIQDDYLDCFGDPSVTGKIGTDIEENKCSWLVIQALSKATPEQRALLEKNYAQKDPSCVAQVKQLYTDLDLPAVYKVYEESSYQSLMKLIDSESGSLPKAMFIDFANRIYKRNK